MSARSAVEPSASIRSEDETGRATSLDTWRRRGSFHSVFNRQIFVVEEGPAAAEPLFVLHGFPTSSLDFHRCLEDPEGWTAAVLRFLEQVDDAEAAL